MKSSRNRRAPSADQAAAKPEARCRVTNGSSLLPTVDGRSVWARLMRDQLAALVAHCGGVDYISEPLRATCRRAAALESELIHIEDKLARTRADGDEPDAATLDLYGRLADRQRRLHEVIGWQRTPRDITPSVDAYARQVAGERAPA